MERSTEGEILMIFVVNAVSIIHTTERKKRKREKKKFNRRISRFKGQNSECQVRYR